MWENLAAFAENDWSERRWMNMHSVAQARVTALACVATWGDSQLR
jgi:hypothetical protein